jgi:O-antigen ligase
MMPAMSGHAQTLSSRQPSTGATVVRFLAWVGLVLVALVLFVVTGGYDAMGSIQSRLAHQAMAYLVLGSWLLVALVRPAWRPRTPLLPALGLALAAYGLSALASQRPRLSLEPALAGAALALTYLFLASLLTDRWFRQRVAMLLVTVVGLVAVAYLAAVGFEWVVFYRLVGQITLPPLRPSWTDLTFGSPNLVATFLLVLGPLAVAILSGLTSRRWPAVALMAAIVVAVFLTGSRGAYLGAALATSALLVLFVTGRYWRVDLRRAARLLRARPVLLVPVAVVGLAVVVAAPLVVYRFAQGGDSLRLDLWRASLAIFAEHPVFGGGPGTWVQLKVEANPPASANLILAHAHNLYLQIAAELGVVGLASLGVLAAAAARRLVVGLQRNPTSHATAAIVGLVAFLGQSFVDNLVNLPYVCVAIMLPLAWVDGGLIAAPAEAAAKAEAKAEVKAETAIRRSRRARLDTALVAALLAALVVPLPILVQINQAAAAQAEGDRSIQLDPAAALVAYDRALSIDGNFTLYRLDRAAALARVGRVADARADLREVVRLDPVGINLISLASLDAELQDVAAARTHVLRAIERAPYEVAVALNAGLIAERIGDRQLALDQLAFAVALRPALAGLPLLADQARLVPKDEIIAAARAISGPEEAALILAYAGEAVRAQAELEARPSSPRREVFLAAAHWLAGDTAGAVDRLQSMVRRNPLDYVAAGWLAGILRAEDDRRAGLYLRLVRLVQADVGPGIAQAVTATITTAEESWFGVPGHYPWAVYVRAFGGNVLAPGLTLVGFQ